LREKSTLKQSRPRPLSVDQDQDQDLELGSRVLSGPVRHTRDEHPDLHIPQY